MQAPAMCIMAHEVTKRSVLRGSLAALWGGGEEGLAVTITTRSGAQPDLATKHNQF